MSKEKQSGGQVLDRRMLLRSGAAAALAAPLGVFGAQALPFRTATPAIDFSEFPICRTASDAPPVIGAPRKLKLSWNAGAVCLAAGFLIEIPVVRNPGAAGVLQAQRGGLARDALQIIAITLVEI